MERGSKLAIHKLKLVEPKNGQPFYKAIVFEKVYNSKKTLGGCWETAFYDAYIFNVELELEEADRSLGVNEKDKYSFDNIANKDKSIIRVIDFKYENHTEWRGGEQVKDDYGKPVVKPVFYLSEIIPNKGTWRSDNGEFKLLQRKFEAQKLKIAEQKRKNLDKDVEYRKIIREIKAEKDRLAKENEKLKQVIENQKESVKKAKFELKESNKQRMVARRKNTIANNELEKAQVEIQKEKQKVIDAKQEIREVKKMKKREVIKNAENFSDDFMFSDMEE